MAHFIKTWHITGENASESPCECATVSCTRCVVRWLWIIGWWEVCVDRLLILISDISFLWEAELMRLMKIHTRPPEFIFTLSALSSHSLCGMWPKVFVVMTWNSKTSPIRRHATAKEQSLKQVLTILMMMMMLLEVLHQHRYEWTNLARNQRRVSALLKVSDIDWWPRMLLRIICLPGWIHIHHHLSRLSVWFSQMESVQLDFQGCEEFWKRWASAKQSKIN